jgi:hypothetical protein
MAKREERLSKREVAIARERRLEAQHLQLIEGNPLDEEDIAMFEMFERERWSHERRLACILEKALALAGKSKKARSSYRKKRKAQEIIR